MAKKNPNLERPAICIPLDSLSTLEQMSAVSQGQFLMACLRYGKNLEQPEFKSIPETVKPLGELKETDKEVLIEMARLETLWEQTQPKIDRDAIGWKDGILQRKYAGYCSGCERKGEPAMSYDEYREWWETREMRETEEFPNLY